MRVWTLSTILVALLACTGGCGDGSAVSRDLGARCERHRDCHERCLSGSDGRFPDGLCSLSCDRNRDCPADAICTEVEGGVCLYSCQNNADCEFLGPTWQCLAMPAHGARQEATLTEVQVCLGS